MLNKTGIGVSTK